MSWACPASMQGLLQGLKYQHTYFPKSPWDKFELVGQHFLVTPETSGVAFSYLPLLPSHLRRIRFLEYIPVRHVMSST
jgi:hypothetical protein